MFVIRPCSCLQVYMFETFNVSLCAIYNVTYLWMIRVSLNTFGRLSLIASRGIHFTNASPNKILRRRIQVVNGLEHITGEIPKRSAKSSVQGEASSKLKEISSLNDKIFRDDLVNFLFRLDFKMCLLVPSPILQYFDRFRWNKENKTENIEMVDSHV